MTCALWYMRYGAPNYEIFDDEHEAAERALSFDETDEGSALGVQYEDGSTLDWDDWNALTEARKHREDEIQRRRAEAAASLEPVTRQIRDPFTGYLLRIDDREPDWLGDTTIP